MVLIHESSVVRHGRPIMVKLHITNGRWPCRGGDSLRLSERHGGQVIVVLTVKNASNFILSAVNILFPMKLVSSDSCKF